MTTFLPPVAAGLRAWRVDQAKNASTWDSGIGAQAFGGRWNPKGVKAVYCSIDAATAILEVAVHKGFRALDTVPHAITAMSIVDPSLVHIVEPGQVPNPGWLSTGVPSAGQQAFGADLLGRHLFVLIPSVVSKHSWNMIFDPDRAARNYWLVLQEPLAIDTRLNLPGA